MEHNLSAINNKRALNTPFYSFISLENNKKAKKQKSACFFP
nr:MAG TPA: hypothetical protein [Caudoviricetes sp.]DAS11422.1 MAG TPA: hypothetical protein [Caudoviricetes sp.]